MGTSPLAAGASTPVAVGGPQKHSGPRGLLEQLEDRGVGLAAALAHGLQAVPDPVSRMWCTSVVMRRAPEAPSGWPRAIAPPTGLSALLFGAGLHLPGQRHRREGLVDLEGADLVDGQPRRRSALAVAGIGPVSIVTGSSPATTAVWTRASGLRPSAAAFSRS